jgi:hypothetical protein
MWPPSWINSISFSAHAGLRIRVGAAKFFFYLQHPITLADLPTMWGDVVFYYQTILFSQLAGVLHDY